MAYLRGYTLKPVVIGLRSRILLLLLFRWLLKPLIWLTAGRTSVKRMLKTQMQLSWPPPRQSHGLPIDYRIINGVPGPVAGDLRDTGKPVLLYLHGGGFILPNSANAN